MKLWKRVRLLVGLDYRCRCGAVIRKTEQPFHEHLHASFREWMSPPTAEEMAQARAPEAQP